MNLLSLVII